MVLRFFRKGACWFVSSLLLFLRCTYVRSVRHPVGPRWIIITLDQLSPYRAGTAYNLCPIRYCNCALIGALRFPNSPLRTEHCNRLLGVSSANWRWVAYLTHSYDYSFMLRLKVIVGVRLCLNRSHHSLSTPVYSFYSALSRHLLSACSSLLYFDTICWTRWRVRLCRRPTCSIVSFSSEYALMTFASRSGFGLVGIPIVIIQQLRVYHRWYCACCQGFWLRYFFMLYSAA